MIINTEQSNDIQVIGDVKEFKTSIDPKNIEYITTLLSSNLYSKPEQSFIREIVSNGWDSHVEAGTTDLPVIIKFKDKGIEGWDITVRDFGTGLSPERFKTIFCNIGSSTKRESNEYIGGFGIGRFSALACSNTVYITSYYEGTAYYYVMVKIGNTITTDLIMEKPTEEKNGVEVTLKNINNSLISLYKTALTYIVFFPNIYIDGVSDYINSISLKRFTNFAVASTSIDYKILLGNVLYPLDNKILTYASKEFINNICSSGIVLKFDIGELSITPNRESIIYSKETVDKINARAIAARTELDTLLDAALTKDYEDIYSFREATWNPITYYPLTNNILASHSWSAMAGGYTSSVYKSNINSKALTLKGKAVDKDFIECANAILQCEILNFKGIFLDERFYQVQNKVPYRGISSTRMTTTSIVILTGNTRLSTIAKDWLCLNYRASTVVTEFSKEDLKSYIADKNNNVRRYLKGPLGDFLLDCMYEYLLSKAVVIDLKTNEDFLAYKESVKNSKVTVTKIKNFILYKQYPESCMNKSYHFKDMTECIQFLKRRKKGIILEDMKGPECFADIAIARGFEYFKARKEIADYIKSLNPSYLIKTDWLYNKDPVTIKLNTIIKVFGTKCPSRLAASRMLRTVPDSLEKEFDSIIALYHGNEDYCKYLSTIKLKCNIIDPYTESICEKLKYYFDTYESLSKEMGISNDRFNTLEETIMAEVIIKTKAYRISSEAYDIVKNNKLIKLLCKR